MKIRPAIDLREGQCVQLVGGSYDNELFRLPDPKAVALEWIEKGFEHLHVVDLDRATNRGDNLEVIKEISSLAKSRNIDIRVGGGIRSTSDADEILALDVQSIVIGTKAIADPQWFETITSKYPRKIYVALEVDGREVKVSGWQETSPYSLDELIEKFNDLELAGVFVTAIHKEGRMQGTDIELFSTISKQSKTPVVASGGVTTLEDIMELSQVGVSEVVLGAAIYTNKDLVYDLQASEFSSRKY